jgi:hypothetical protein
VLNVPDDTEPERQTGKRHLAAGGGGNKMVREEEKNQGGENRAWMDAIIKSKDDLIISKDQLIKELKDDKEILQKEKSSAEKKVQDLTSAMFTQGLNPSFNEDYSMCQKNLNDLKIKRMEGIFLFYFIFLSFILN